MSQSISRYPEENSSQLSLSALAKTLSLPEDSKEIKIKADHLKISVTARGKGGETIRKTEYFGDELKAETSYRPLYGQTREEQIEKRRKYVEDMTKNGLSQQEMADTLGVSQQTISKDQRFTRAGRK